jgi:hypothetical protein
MSTHKTSHAATPIKQPPKIPNSPIAVRAAARKAELEAALQQLPATDTRMRSDIELALAEVTQWLAGDPANMSHVVSAELSTWLERTKHLAQVTPKAKRPRH